ncbi:peptide chain release factor 2 [Horticoccus luteus]|uniref:Peptide chain release factor 2 n=1 Tax=Horticoccus luteus TaxID=2862869 RepID=A0A8F9TRK2_9BACT|nr:peptide chain release factor 2 [Horticoccus luteus]QYM77894.1 peptide chain release factor 2 [Horticoccus luteus]
MIVPETFNHIENIKKRAGHLWRFLDVEQKQREIEAMEAQMGAPEFWDNSDRAQKHIAKLNGLKRIVLPIVSFQKKVADLNTLLELIEMGSASEQEEFSREVEALVKAMLPELDEIEIGAFLTGQFDRNNAIFSIQAGAGGTESNDWADLLFRMYTRWAERRGFTIEVQDVQVGDQAGISKATILIKGENAYGYAKAERGVHRLVRISPFDSNQRRHTSFCAVDVIAEITDEIKVDIPEDELRIDVYRSSGKGGQGVNTTDSAVRITHIPSGIVVVCQNERSQIKNKASAMSILKARLYEKRQDEQRAEMDKFYGEKGEIGWGSQIRSYVLQPYQMVKDLRTGISTSDTQGVLDGDLDRFVNAWLRAGCPRHRNKEIQMEE